MSQMEISKKDIKNSRKIRRPKNARSLQVSGPASREKGQELYASVVKVLQRLELENPGEKSSVTESIKNYKCGRLHHRGRPAKDMVAVVPALIFREIQGALDKKPLWYKEAKKAKPDSASQYWFNHSELWWKDLWGKLESEFKHLMTLNAPTKRSWNTQVRHLISKVLGAALRRRRVGTTVIQVPPGMGKTTGTIEALCHLPRGTRAHLKGDHPKILWFVRESRVTEKTTGKNRTSLGSEVFLEFKRRGAAVQVIESPPDVVISPEERENVRWHDSTRPEVKILAHAHLPLMFRNPDGTGLGRWLRALKDQADLVVIDEDPLQSLIFSEAELPELPAWPILVELMEKSGVLQQGQDALKHPQTPAGIFGQNEAYWKQVREQPDQLFRGTYRKMTPENHDAWMQLWAGGLTERARDETPPFSAGVWAAFCRALQKACSEKWPAGLREDQRKRKSKILRSNLNDLLCELRADLVGCLDGKPSTLRFSLRWTPDQEESAQVHPSLRFSVLKPFVLTTGNASGRGLPVVVLDAYADERRYKKLFGSSTTVERLEHDAAFELQVEQLDLAKELRKSTVASGFAQRHLLRLMTESTLLLLDARQRLPRPVLFLGPQAVTSGQPVQRRIAPVINAQESYQFAHRWLHYLTPVQESTDTSQRFQSAYWFAGRGRNQFAGSDVVALSAPRYPEKYQDQLAALAPATTADEEERQRLSKHDEAAELLQMLHRGRQVLWHLKPQKNQPPRVLVLFSVKDYQLSGQATVRPLEIKTDTPYEKPHQKFSYNRLGSLLSKGKPSMKYSQERGKLELTKMVGVAVLMELLRPPAEARTECRGQPSQGPDFPGGWFPERLLVRLGILDHTWPADVKEDLVVRAYLEELKLSTATPHTAPDFRFTAAALQRAGLWETMPLGRKEDTQAWAPPGTLAYLKPILLAFFEARFTCPIVVERHPLRHLGTIWRLEDTDVDQIEAWSRAQILRLERQDQGGHQKRRGRREGPAFLE